MKKIIENKKQQKLNIGLIVILCLLMSLCLAGCQKDNDKKVEYTSSKTQTTVTAPEKEVETKEEVIVEEPIKMTLRDWSATIEYSEPKLAIWNFDIGQGKVLNNGEEYELLDGDNVYVYSPAEYKEILFSNGPAVERLDLLGNFTEVTYKDKFKAKNDISLTVVGVNGNDFELNVCLLSPNASEEIDEKLFTLATWVEELRETEKEPRVIVWNEDTQEKKVLEQGEEYHIKEGDKTGVYYPTTYTPYTAQPDNTASYEMTYGCTIFELSDMSKINFKYQFVDESGNIIDITAIFTNTD